LAFCHFAIYSCALRLLLEQNFYLGLQKKEKFPFLVFAGIIGKKVAKVATSTLESTDCFAAL